jgi:hypothetical protein
MSPPAVIMDQFYPATCAYDSIGFSTGAWAYNFERVSDLALHFPTRQLIASANQSYHLPGLDPTAKY